MVGGEAEGGKKRLKHTNALTNHSHGSTAPTAGNSPSTTKTPALTRHDLINHLTSPPDSNNCEQDIDMILKDE